MDNCNNEDNVSINIKIVNHNNDFYDYIMSGIANEEYYDGADIFEENISNISASGMPLTGMGGSFEETAAVAHENQDDGSYYHEYKFDRRKPGIVNDISAFNNKAEFYTTGKIIEKDDCYEITYRERHENGKPTSLITFIVMKNNPDIVFMNISATGINWLTFENKKRVNCECNGNTSQLFGITAKSMTNTINRNGGELEINYVVDLYGNKIDESSYLLKIKKIGS